MAEPQIKVEREPSNEPEPWKKELMLAATSHESSLSQPAFQNALRAEAGVLKLLKIIIDKLPKSSKKSMLQENLKMTHQRRRPEPRMIGLVGMSGHGKSSILGEIVGDSGVAKYSSSGKAVTHIAQEYAQRPDGAQFAYQLVCNFDSEDEIKEQMGRLLDDWRHLELQGITPRDPEFKVINENSKAALNAIRAALGGLKELNLQCIEYGKNGVTRDEALKFLHRWVALMPLPEGCTPDGNYTKDFDDATALQKAIQDFQETGLWPFVGKMQILFDSALLKDGLVIADLPGSFDSNYVRARTADTYLPKVQEIWIVARISRAVDNPVIEAIADRYFRDLEDVGDLQRPVVNIICTFAAEELDDADWDHIHIDHTALQDAEKTYTAAKAAGLYADVEAAMRRLQSLKMKARNDKVAADIIEEWSSIFAPGQLRVFCIDNKMHRKGGPDMELSGIPELRRHTSGTIASEHYKVAITSLCTHTPALISSLQTYVEIMKSPPLDLKREIAFGKEQIKGARADYEEWETAVSDGCSMISIAARSKRQSILKSACYHLEAWGNLHGTTICAFFRRRGVWKVKGIAVSWCSQLLRCILLENKSRWKKLDKLAKSSWKRLIASIMARLENQEGRYGKSGGESSVARLFSNGKNQMKILLEQEQDTFIKNLHQIKRKAVTSDTNSFIFEVMEPTFLEGMDDRGAGVKARHMERLRLIVSTGAFCVAYIDKVETECQALLDSTNARFSDLLTHFLDELKADLEPAIKAQASESFSQHNPILQGELDAYMWDLTLQKENMDRHIESAKALAKELWGFDAVATD